MVRAGHPLVERRAQLDALTGLLARVRAGAGGLALVEADAGLGKSRLLAELRARAGDDDVRVCAARASELERAFTFGVLRTLLAGAVRDLAPARRDALLAGAPAPAAVALALSPEAQARTVESSPALLDAIYWLVDGLCEDGPLVLVVDDAHWADAPSLRALAYLANRADALPLGLVCAQRPQQASADPDATAALARVASVRVELAPLSAAGVADMATSAVPRPLGAEAARALHVATRGNPFLVSQVVRELAADGPDGIGHGAVISAGALRGVIAGRLAGLSAGVGDVARIVSVLGDGAHLRDVAGLTGLDDEAVLRAAGALIEAGLFVDAALLGFAHPLLAEAIDAELTAADRALQNLRAARWLAAHGAEPERVAVHLVRSTPAGDPDAVVQLRAAADDALRRGAPETAIAHLERALAEPPKADEQVAVWVELGLAELAAGRDADAVPHLAVALEDPRWPLTVASAAARATAAEGGYAAVLEAYLRGAAARRGHDDEAADVLAAMAAHFNVFVATFQRQEVVLAPRDGLTGQTLRERLTLVAHAAESLDDGTAAEEAATLARLSLADGTLPGDVDGQGALFCAMPLMVLLYAERLDVAEHELRLMERQAREQAAAGSVLSALIPRSMLLLLHGDVAALGAQSEVALSVSSLLTGVTREGNVTFLVALQLLGLLAQSGPDAADAVLAAHGFDGQLEPHWLYLAPVRAHVHCAAGRIEAALADVEFWRACIGFIDDPILPIEFHTAEPVVLAAAGRTADAIAAAERELARARAWGTAGRTAALLRVLAELRPEAGEELLEEAWELASSSPLMLERARVRLARGLALRRSGARTAARAELEQAVQLATDCHAGVLVERGLAELRVLGARPRRAAFSGVDALTNSERRVADLAAAGATNREIAQELFVTVKTIDSHLGRVYRKLGVSGRGELPGLLREGALDAV